MNEIYLTILTIVLILYRLGNGVVSIGTNPTFKARLVPHEVIPTIPPLSHYIINICLYLAYLAIKKDDP